MWGVIMLMLSIGLFQVPSLLRGKKYRELAAFFMLWLIAGTYAYLVVIEVSPVSPFMLIIQTVTYINNRLPLFSIY